MIQVREYSQITTDSGLEPSLDIGVVKQATFDWMVDVLHQSGKTEKVLVIKNRKILKLGKYVGYLQSPKGEAIEILPKTGLGVESAKKSRIILQQMLMTALSLKPREVGQASLKRLNQPIHEWIFLQFLNELRLLITKGIRFDYERIEEESSYLKGQLQVAKQLRRMPGRDHLFDIRHDVFTPNRLENRIIKSALLAIKGYCKEPNNWRMANEFSHLMNQINSEPKPMSSFHKWRSSKLMQTYEDIKPWCKLILEEFNPNFQKGKHNGISLLFPMEQLFEKYVEVNVNKQIQSSYKLKPQASSQYLTEHHCIEKGQVSEWFKLKPDLLLISKQQNQVLDIKWKLINEMADTVEHKYNIKQSDLYQLFAYGHKYQDGKGHMMLIYPKHDNFTLPLPCFSYSESLHLWVVPFCLEEKVLIEGDWQQHFPGILNANKNLMEAS